MKKGSIIVLKTLEELKKGKTCVADRGGISIDGKYIRPDMYNMFGKKHVIEDIYYVWNGSIIEIKHERSNWYIREEWIEKVLKGK